MKIIKAKVENSKEISNIIKQAISNLSKEYSKNQIRVWKRINRLKEIRKWFAKRQIFIVIEKEKAIGIAALKENKISRFFIKPSYQKKGIGKKLIAFLEKKAKSKGYSKTILEAVPSAYGFYKKQGYKTIGKIPCKYYNVKFPEIKMEKRI